MDAFDEEAHRVLVVIDVGKDFSYTALDWTLDNGLRCGDTLKLLGVLQQLPSQGFQAGLSKCKCLALLVSHIPGFIIVW